MAVFRNIEVPIPKERVTIERQKNGKPALIKYVLEAPYNKEKGYAEPKRTTIGHQSLKHSGMMNPTTQYADIFPALWEEAAGIAAKPKVKKMGIFSYGQAVNSYNGLKDLLDSVYGTHADSIMDYALYSLFYHTGVTMLFESAMKRELLYSQVTHLDSYYSNLFERGMSKEEELLFKKKWALECKKDGVEEVYLCIDGLNDDCSSQGVEIAQKGHAKSQNNANIVSFTYAIDPNGKPVTYEVCNGGLVDAKAFNEIIDFLKKCGIKVKGVILDRGCCDSKAIEYLVKEKIEYCIMVKGTSEGFTEIVNLYGNQIKMNANFLIPKTCLFGVQQQVQLFKTYKKTDYLTLFYDYQNGNARITTLLNHIYEEIDKAEAQIANGQRPVFEKKYSKILEVTSVDEGESQSYKVSINAAELQIAMDEKGLYSIVTSTEMPPEEVHKLYVARTASEIQYCSMKTQLGYGTVRIQNTQSVRSQFMMAFLASIMRHEAVLAADDTGKSTNYMLSEISRLEMLNVNGVYTYTHTESGAVEKFFNHFGVDAKELLDESVTIENDRLAGRVPTLRKRKTGPRRGSHKPKLDENGNPVSKKKGVATGTKRSDTNADGSTRKKPGVPPGTKRGELKNNGEVRKKPGPKPGSHRKPKPESN